MLYGKFDFSTQKGTNSYNVYGYQCTYNENIIVMNSRILSSPPSNYAYNAYSDECGQTN